MFERILQEIDRHCAQCTGDCKKYDCVIYRINQIITANIDVAVVDIDEFFETEKKNQISIFDVVGGDDF